MARVWRLRLLGGMGVSLIVPGMLLASLAVLALAGGFGGLTALGQAFSGPPAPAAALTGVRAGVPPHPLPPRLVAALAAPAAAAPSSAPTGVPGTPAPSGSVRAGAPGPIASIGPTVGVSHPGVVPAARSQPGSPPAPKSPPTVADKIVGAGSSVTEQLPGPVGSSATSALKTAGAALDSIVPIKSP
jgi:hypothetical protein